MIERSDLATATKAMKMLRRYLNEDYPDIVDLGVAVVDPFIARCPDSLEAAITLLELGECLFFDGDWPYRKSRDYYVRALEIFDRNFPTSKERLQAAQSLGSIFEEEAKLSQSKDVWIAKAKSLLFDTFRIYRKVNPHLNDTALSLTAIADHFRRWERYQLAEVSLVTALATRNIDRDEARYTVKVLREIYSK